MRGMCVSTLQLEGQCCCQGNGEAKSDESIRQNGSQNHKYEMNPVPCSFRELLSQEIRESLQILLVLIHEESVNRINTVRTNTFRHLIRKMVRESLQCRLLENSGIRERVLEELNCRLKREIRKVFGCLISKNFRQKIIFNFDYVTTAAGNLSLRDFLLNTQRLEEETEQQISRRLQMVFIDLMKDRVENKNFKIRDVREEILSELRALLDVHVDACFTNQQLWDVAYGVKIQLLNMFAIATNSLTGWLPYNQTTAFSTQAETQIGNRINEIIFCAVRDAMRSLVVEKLTRELDWVACIDLERELRAQIVAMVEKELCKIFLDILKNYKRQK